MSEYKNDHETYYEMSKPFTSAQEANESIEKFFEELAELRKKHHITNLFVVATTNINDCFTLSNSVPGTCYNAAQINN